MSTVQGIEAIKQYLPPTKRKIDTNIKEECGQVIKPVQEHTLSNEMSSMDRYNQEWKELLENLDENAEHARNLALNSELKTSKYRSIYWAVLLRVLNADHHSWKAQRWQQRSRYEKFKQDFVKNPHDIEEPDDNPLSQSIKSIWNQYFSDQELFAIIRQDVVRTFPGVDFFRKPVIQNAMSNILFYYAREHPYMCYRQGMHEILAPILFVMYGDHQALLHFMELSHAIDEKLLDVLNPDCLEPDSYSIFARVMASIESYYRIPNLEQTQSGTFVAPVDHSETISSEAEVIGQLNSIRDKILAKEDLHLHNYLLKLDIPLHIFGIRWLRLLFGREFPLLDLLVLWDAIFADSDRFDLPHYILVAMLIRIRDKLLLSDYTTCLTSLMRYPTNVDINLILRHALHLQMPKKFDRPPNAFVYFTMNPKTSTVGSDFKALPIRERTPSITTPRLLTQQEPQTRKRSTSLGPTENAQLERQITQSQARNAADAAALAKLKMKSQTSDSVMDGLSKNSPELLTLELKNAQTVISIARLKLQNYAQTVRKYIAKNNSLELAQALDGIEELCSFLDIKFMFPLNSSATPIDQAFEVNEKATLSHNKVAKDVRKTASQIQVANTATVADPMSSTVTVTTLPAESASTTYEKPDNGFSTARILGNIKEIELIAIAPDEKSVNVFDVPMKSTLPTADPRAMSQQLSLKFEENDD